MHRPFKDDAVGHRGGSVAGSDTVEARAPETRAAADKVVEHPGPAPRDIVEGCREHPTDGPVDGPADEGGDPPCWAHLLGAEGDEPTSPERTSSIPH